MAFANDENPLHTCKINADIFPLPTWKEIALFCDE
jgi:hypothetical protein